jgi:hypothetical protein
MLGYAKHAGSAYIHDLQHTAFARSDVVLKCFGRLCSRLDMYELRISWTRGMSRGFHVVLWEVYAIAASLEIGAIRMARLRIRWDWLFSNGHGWARWFFVVGLAGWKADEDGCECRSNELDIYVCFDPGCWRVLWAKGSIG